MSELDELRRRIQALEDRHLIEAAARAGQDTDLSDVQDRIRATHHLVQALSITQGEHTRSLERLATSLVSLASLAAGQDERLTRIEDRLDRILAMLEAGRDE